MPNDLPRPPGELEGLEKAWKAPRGWRLISSVNNTCVGLFYIATALAFFVAANVLALRAEAAEPWLIHTLAAVAPANSFSRAAGSTGLTR